METTQEVVENTPEVQKGVKLTKEVAHLIVDHIKNGVSFYFRDDKTIRLKSENGELIFPAGTYDTWIFSGKKVIDTNRTLKEMVNSAKEQRRKDLQARADKMRVEEMEKALDVIIKSPVIGKRIERRLKRQKDTGEMKEVERVITQEVSAPIMSAKIKGITFGLERLDPERYGRKDETKNTHIVGVFSLADLRQKRNNDELSE